MKEFSKYVGLDVHKDTIAVAVADAGGGEVSSGSTRLDRKSVFVKC